MASTPPSLTRQAIRDISAGPCRDALAPFGFRRAAPNFWRVVDGLVQSVSFQASAFGSRDANSFTVNLGITSPALALGLYGQRLAARPASGVGPIAMRIGLLTPSQRDLWWDVDATTDIAAIGGEVAVMLRDYAVPWFDALGSRRALLRAIEDAPASLGLFRPWIPLTLAVLAVEDGEPERARALLQAAFEEQAASPFRQAIQLVATRLGLSLDA
jgi:hypothetical protein